MSSEAEGASGAVAVLGGTFDPPHVGHLIVAQDVYEALDVERVVWVPAGRPPHKPVGGVTPPELRLEMTRAAVGGDGRFAVSDVEIRRDGVSYTVDTLREMAEEAPGRRVHLVMGADQLGALGRWRDPEEISRLARIVVMTRGGGGAADLAGPPGVEYEVLPVTRIDVSSANPLAR